jgi:hypothetical protein
VRSVAFEFCSILCPRPVELRQSCGVCNVGCSRCSWSCVSISHGVGCGECWESMNSNLCTYPKMLVVGWQVQGSPKHVEQFLTTMKFSSDI